MNPKDSMKIAMLAGEIMLSNGAETYRVEDTMRRILLTFHFTIAETFVTTTGIFASIEDSEAGLISMLRRVKTRTIHLEKVTLVNQFSRDLVEGNIRPEDAIAALEKINATPTYRSIIRVLAAAGACFCFAQMFRGSLRDSLCAFVACLVFYPLSIQLGKKQVSSILTNVSCGGIISMMAILFLNLGLGDNMDKIITASLMPLVPGVGITNAVRDILEGDYLSGTSRTMDAIIVSVAIATGVGAVLKIWLYWFGRIVL